MALLETQTSRSVVQLMAPRAILTGVTQILKTDGYTVVRAGAEVSYQINGAGTIAVIPAGTALGIHPSITSIDFQAPVAILEVM